LSPTRKGCEYKISHSAKIKILIIGRKAERYVVSIAVKDVKEEVDSLLFGIGFIDGYGYFVVG
jgi:hypothetical protein